MRSYFFVDWRFLTFITFSFLLQKLAIRNMSAVMWPIAKLLWWLVVIMLVLACTAKWWRIVRRLIGRDAKTSLYSSVAKQRDAVQWRQWWRNWVDSATELWWRLSTTAWTLLSRSVCDADWSARYGVTTNNRREQKGRGERREEREGERRGR